MKNLLNISGNIEYTTKGRPHILKMSGLREYCGYSFKNHTCESKLKTECHKYIQTSKTTFASRLAPVVFCGTPCMYIVQCTYSVQVTPFTCT